jgi:hypothetical protein
VAVARVKTPSSPMDGHYPSASEPTIQLKTLFYRLVPLGLGGLGNRSPSKNAIRLKMASRIRKDVTPYAELAVEELLPMVIPLFFMWQSLARVSPQLLVFLLATCLSAFPLSLQSQRTIEVRWR